MGWTACWPSPEEGAQGNVHCTVQHRNTRQQRRDWHAEARSTAAAEKVTAHRSEDRNESEEAVIDAEEATTKACDPAKVGLVPHEEINLEEPEIKETNAVDDNETEVIIFGEFVYASKLRNYQNNQTF